MVEKKLNATLHNNLIEHRIAIDSNKSNAVESFYSMGANERRLILYIISKVVKDHRINMVTELLKLNINEIHIDRNITERYHLKMV